MEFDEIAEDIATSSASFTDIRRNGYIYVDKTDLIYQLACKRDCCVFTRPRCFGKTLLCSTLVELFKHGVEPYDGHHSYFRGLAIHKLWDDKGKYHVFHISHSFIDDHVFKDAKLFAKSQIEEIVTQAKEFSFEVPDKAEDQDLGKILDSVFSQAKRNSLVFIVDEYDYPITVGDAPKSNYNVIRSVYEGIKRHIDKFRFIFIAGVTHYDMNTFYDEYPAHDLSYDPTYATLLGLTRDDIFKYFPDHLKYVARKFFNRTGPVVTKSDMENAYAVLEKNYGGFAFTSDDSQRVLNPWNIFKHFNDPNPDLGKHHWLRPTGEIPPILKKIFTELVDNYELRENLVIEVNKNKFTKVNSFERMDYRVLLAQTGYLTFHKLTDNIVYLRFPNYDMYWAFENFKNFLKGLRYTEAQEYKPVGKKPL